MKKIFFLTLFFINLFLIKSGLPADPSMPSKSEGDLTFYLDAASFRAIEGKTIEEIYYNIPLNQLSFQKSTKGFIDSLQFTLVLTDSFDQEFIYQQWVDAISVDSLEKIEGRLLPQQIELTVYPGEYVVSLKILELSTGFSGRARLKIHASSFAVDSFITSDIQVASIIISDTSQTQFVKNGVKIIPNPNRIFGKTLPVLYFYVEIYNLQPAESEDQNTYEVKYYLYDLDNVMVREFPSKIKTKPGTSSFDVGGINIASINLTALKLMISITDNLSGQMATSEKIFWNLSFEHMVTLFYKNEAEEKLIAMSEKEIKQHFDQIKYILSPKAISEFNKLDNDAKRNFLINFWFSNDPTPETYQNEFWDYYFNNVDYVNQHFSTSFTKGWKTDRGRIVLKYGKPDEIQFYPLQTDSKPYEVWYYYKPEQMKFIFIDEEGFGRYRLIYSSDEKEVTDPDWQLIIGIGGNH